MKQIFTIQNEFLQLSVKETGAELCSIKKRSNGQEYMWDANPKVWAGQAPVLFPIVGALKDGVFVWNEQRYALPKHGFVRKNSAVKLVNKSESSLCFQLKYTSESLKIYPFQFEFLITFSLDANKIITKYEVLNHGEESMYFSLGGHPAFKCPLEEGEKYSDYFLEFERAETANTYPIDKNDLMGPKADLILDNSKQIDLHHGLFNNGALVFKNLTSECVSLVSRVSGKRLDVSFKGFPYLGFWAKPNADYVCIEPWIGINDDQNTDQQLETKEGIVSLEATGHFQASYIIRIY